MFSGKTTEMLRLTERHERAGRKRVLVKPAIDDRYKEENVNTHDSRSFPARRISRLAEVIDVEERVIGVDEGQFFPDLITACMQLVAKGKIVVVAGLSSNSKMEPFGQMLHLLAVCDSSVMLTAVCKECGEDAPFTLMLNQGPDEVVVGSDDKYKALCRVCYGEAHAPSGQEMAEHEEILREKRPPKYNADTKRNAHGLTWGESRALVVGSLLRPQVGSSPPSSTPSPLSPQETSYPVDCAPETWPYVEDEEGSRETYGTVSVSMEIEPGTLYGALSIVQEVAPLTRS